MQKASPDWLQSRIHHYLDLFLGFLEKLRLRRPFLFEGALHLIFILFFLLSFIGFRSSLWQELNLGNPSTLRFYPVLSLLGLAVVGGNFVVSFFSGPRAFSILWFFLTLLAPLLLFSFREGGLSWQVVPPLIFSGLGYVFLWIALWVSRDWLRTRRWLFLAAVFFLICCLNEGFISQDFIEVRNFWALHPSRWFLTFSYLILEENARLKNSRGAFWSLCAFTQFIFPLPLRSHQLAARSETARVRLRGGLDFFFAVAAAFLCLLVDIGRPHPHSFRLEVGLINYLYAFFLSYSYINFFIGALRWLGYDLPSAYDLPLLAATPTERWRRWNTYFYNWLYTVIFFPAFKKTRSLVGSLGLVYLAVCFIHLGHYSVIYYRRPDDSNLPGLLTFFLAHMGAIFLSLRFEKYWPSGRSLRGWWGVAFTWLLMCGIHLLIYF
jgi:hypothetical protein